MALPPTAAPLIWFLAPLMGVAVWLAVHRLRICSAAGESRSTRDGAMDQGERRAIRAGLMVYALPGPE